ncbi:metal-dependent transcriptional regulator [Marinigracilibium pacificum]|uniref:Transcriptional regulator MntR n=1 Tax=Marinigracilibium pacificum TaxID=2729599 RepID=A0A848J6L7_9BACT|nr:metal-dependent transcriptional regulator [Marinigracilibium pacificum]NMM50029.1 metal-dependent transcriptional regulator [Marinigracilibium pacificum]
MLSYTEENYLKAIYHLSAGGEQEVSTNSIADSLHTKAASVSDMLKKLSIKNLVEYRRYKGVNVSEEGKKEALKIIRKHRLWEVFLVNHLKFKWDEVHDVAEQLEHIKSPLLIKRLDEFLGFPSFDPHGDPIPDEFGVIKDKAKIMLKDLDQGCEAVVVAVSDDNPAFLQYCSKLGISIGTPLKALEKLEFDQSMQLLLDGEIKINVSKEVSENIWVTD